MYKVHIIIFKKINYEIFHEIFHDISFQMHKIFQYYNKFFIFIFLIRFIFTYNCHNLPSKFYIIKKIITNYSLVMVFFSIIRLKWYILFIDEKTYKKNNGSILNIDKKPSFAIIL